MTNSKDAIMVAGSELAQVSTLEALYQKLPDLNMEAGWNKTMPSLWPEPRKNFLPAHWRYSQAKGALDAGGRLINTELAERRNMVLINPLEGNTYATARTMVVAYQMIMPGERARSHRHTPNALRLILDSEPGTYTVVNGNKIPMLSGDVLLTPNWAWHGHGNDGNACAYWLDFLDVPLVQLLEPIFFEHHPDEFEQNIVDAPTSPFYFPWQETQRRLEEASADPAGHYGTQVELGNPALATISLHMMRLAPKSKTRPLRTTSNIIYAAVAGSGTTYVDGERFDWQRGDVMVAPAWRTHHHETERGGVLFRVSDAPAMERLGLLRAENGAVTAG
jgi:gentisate 1,2-dioxygenase